MKRGNRNNASGQQRSGSSTGSSSGKYSALTHGTGNNKNAGNCSSRNNGSSSGNNRSSKREDDDGNHVPGTNVVRIMRTVLPTHAKISDGAKEAVQDCVSEYISLITSEANERCMREHRKTLIPEDLLYAVAKLGFDDYIQPLTLYLNRYRESESERTSVSGEPTVYRTVNYQHLLGSLGPPPPPPPHEPVNPPPPVYINPQVAPPPPSIYFVNPAEAAIRGFRVAPPAAGSTVDFAGPSTYRTSSVCPHNAAAYPPPPPPGDNPSRKFFM